MKQKPVIIISFLVRVSIVFVYQTLNIHRACTVFPKSGVESPGYSRIDRRLSSMPNVP